jgi:hypothetical protein
MEKHILKFPEPDEGPKNLWKEFVLPKPQYEDERHAPPVDWEALQAFIDKKMLKEEVRKLYRLTPRFRSRKARFQLSDLVLL